MAKHTSQTDLLRIVGEDLKFLEEEWDQDITDASLRITSPVLRRLLVDNLLQRAWKASGLKGQPRITCPNLEWILSGISKKKTIFASAGGGKYKGVEIEGAILMNFALSEEQVAQRSRHRQGIPIETLTLAGFIRSPCIIAQGKEISRRLLIQYVANKLGGAHWSPARKQAQNDMLFALLDQISQGVILADKNAVYFELLSIGQALVNSPDIQTLRKNIT